MFRVRFAGTRTYWGTPAPRNYTAPRSYTASRGYTGEMLILLPRPKVKLPPPQATRPYALLTSRSPN